MRKILFIMDGVNVRRNINIDDLIHQFKQYFPDLLNIF